MVTYSMQRGRQERSMRPAIRFTYRIGIAVLALLDAKPGVCVSGSVDSTEQRGAQRPRRRRRQTTRQPPAPEPSPEPPPPTECSETDHAELERVVTMVRRIAGDDFQLEGWWTAQDTQLIELGTTVPGFEYHLAAYTLTRPPEGSVVILRSSAGPHTSPSAWLSAFGTGILRGHVVGTRSFLAQSDRRYFAGAVTRGCVAIALFARLAQ